MGYFEIGYTFWIRLYMVTIRAYESSPLIDAIDGPGEIMVIFEEQ